MTPKEIDIALAELEERVDRLRALYEQYFMGYEKLEPTVARKEVDRRFAVLRKENIRNTAQRFKLNVITQKFNTYAMYWGRICRQIEEGTYKRHVQRAKKRFGEAGGREREASIDIDLSEFDLEAEGGLDDFDVGKLLGETERAGAAVEIAPTSVRSPAASQPDAFTAKSSPAFQPYRPAAASSPDLGAQATGAKKIVRKKDGTLGPVTPAVPFQPMQVAAKPPSTPPAQRVPAPTASGRLPAALPPGAPISSRAVPASAPSTGRLPAAPPPGGPRPVAPPPGRMPAPSAPGVPAASGPRLPAAPPPGSPFSSGRLPAAPPPGAPLSSQRLPAAPPPGPPVSSQRLPAAPPSAAGTGRFPAAPPPGGPRPMIRPAIRPITPSSPDLGEVGSGDKKE